MKEDYNPNLEEENSKESAQPVKEKHKKTKTKAIINFIVKLTKAIINFHIELTKEIISF